MNSEQIAALAEKMGWERPAPMGMRQHMYYTYKGETGQSLARTKNEREWHLTPAGGFECIEAKFVHVGPGYSHVSSNLSEGFHGFWYVEGVYHEVPGETALAAVEAAVIGSMG